MTFVYPLLLGGLLLAGVPVLLHFLVRQKPKTLLFPAFRFLIQKRRLDDLEWVYKTSFLRFVIRFGAVRIGLLGGVLFFPFAPQQSG